ncbi:MAG: branched-chain amino acid aminotransferase [Proteobacteria bacterium]|nr:branched-chain amino acid aminotransferase [Pseudomonadota bacterium]
MSLRITRTSSPQPLPPADQLGFGQYFTDHLFFADFANGSWTSGEIIPYQNFQLDPAASVLHYGQALFEGMKAFKHPNHEMYLFRPKFNAERMQKGAERLSMQAPPTDLFIEGIRELLKVDARWMPEGVGKSIYIRPTLIGTEGFLGVRPSNHFRFFVILSPVGQYYSNSSKAVKIFIEEEDLRAAPGGLGNTKAAANYAASLRAALKAKHHGYAQVLWLDTSRRFVEEVGTMNIFFRVGDEVWTPRLNGSILEGGTRACVIQLLKSYGVIVHERDVALADLQQAYENRQLKEAFGTGTAAVITPIEEISSQKIAWKFTEPSENSISQKLFKDISSIQHGLSPDRFSWLMKV